MKEIMFRAWDKNHKKMFYNIQNKDYIDEFDCFMDFGVWLSNKRDWTIMQFIGIKDKDGKEIYEGDIITNRFNETLEVMFNTGCFYGSGNGGYKLDTQYWKNQDVIIIGNKFENPELLK